MTILSTNPKSSDPLKVLEAWIPVDPSVHFQARGVMPGSMFVFRYTAPDNTIARAEVTYEQVQLVLARLTLKGMIK